MSYDRQVIVQFDDDPTIEAGAVTLNNYCNMRGIPSCIVRMLHWSTVGNVNVFNHDDRAALTSAFKDLTHRSRIYLLAHGDWQSRRLHAHDAGSIAALLSSCKMPEVSIVSVLGCELARDTQGSAHRKITHSIDSFAGLLHRLLASMHGVRVRLYARVDSVGVITSEMTKDENMIGKKYTADLATRKIKFQGRHTKMEFYWEGAKQRRDWAY
jgi:hypothetical protein